MVELRQPFPGTCCAVIGQQVLAPMKDLLVRTQPEQHERSIQPKGHQGQSCHLEGPWIGDEKERARLVPVLGGGMLLPADTNLPKYLFHFYMHFMLFMPTWSKKRHQKLLRS